MGAWKRSCPASHRIQKSAAVRPVFAAFEFQWRLFSSTWLRAGRLRRLWMNSQSLKQKTLHNVSTLIDWHKNKKPRGRMPFQAHCTRGKSVRDQNSREYLIHGSVSGEFDASGAFAAGTLECTAFTDRAP